MITMHMFLVDPLREFNFFKKEKMPFQIKENDLFKVNLRNPWKEL